MLEMMLQYGIQSEICHCFEASLRELPTTIVLLNNVDLLFLALRAFIECGRRHSNVNLDCLCVIIT